MINIRSEVFKLNNSWTKVAHSRELTKKKTLQKSYILPIQADYWLIIGMPSGVRPSALMVRARL